MKTIQNAFQALFTSLPTQSGDFDENWYLEQYPDVAASGASPWRHYFVYGQAEGRLPNASHAQLWAVGDTSVLESLHSNLSHARREEVNHAAWSLGRWYASRGAWDKVLDVMGRIDTLTVAQRLLWIDALQCCGHFERAQGFLEEWEDDADGLGDLHLAFANLRKKQWEAQGEIDEAEAQWLNRVNRLYKHHDLTPVSLRASDHSMPCIDRLESACPSAPAPSDRFLVSIIIPVHNAQTTIVTALNSLLRQSWQALEVIVVDDASTDDTVNQILAVAKNDPRVRLVTLPVNGGAYVARNKGLSLANGEFMTVHDSDDWSHPEKIEQQVKVLIDSPKVMCTLSHWVRASSDLIFGGWQTPENWGGWIHRNISSLMLRRTVFEKLGYWDRVRCSADNEYYYRVLHAYGPKAVREVLPGIPLSIGRTHAGSLTQKPETGIFTIFGGLRKEYDNAFCLWHKSAIRVEDLYLEQTPARRPFPVPQGMLVNEGQS